MIETIGVGAAIVAAGAATGVIGWAWGEHAGRQRAGRVAATRKAARADERAAQGVEGRRQQHAAGTLVMDGATATGYRVPPAMSAADLQRTLVLPAARDRRPSPAEALAVCAACEWWCPECGKAGTFVPRAGTAPATVALTARYLHRFMSHECGGRDLSIHSGTVGPATD